MNTLHQSDKLNRVSEGAELLYRRLLEVVDNGGNYFADPHLLLGHVFAHRMSRGLTPKNMLDRIQELVGVGLVDVYADGKLLHISRYYTRLRSDRHGADIRFDPFPGPTDPTPDSDRTPPGVHPDSTRCPQNQNRDRIESEIEIEESKKRKESQKRREVPPASADGLALAETAYDLITRNHPNLPSLKDRTRRVAAWAKDVDRFLRKSGKTAEECRAFLTWLAQDRESKAGSRWIGWWQPFQSVGILGKDAAWAAYISRKRAGRSRYDDVK